MNTSDLLHKLSLLHGSTLDDCAKCRQAIDLIRQELKALPPSRPVTSEVKKQLLKNLDEFYARALHQQMTSGHLSQLDHRCTSL